MATLADTKEKLQQVIDELSDHYGEIYELRVRTRIEDMEGPIAIIDKIFVSSLQETEV